MRHFRLLILFTLIACQDNIPSRSTISDSAVNSAPPSSTGQTTSFRSTQLHSRCQSSARCFYAQMPVYNQNNFMLENYVGNKIGVSQYHDAGLCAPTSGAMVLRAVLSEKDGLTKLNNTFLNFLPYQPWYETIYQIGVDAQTDFLNGGTTPYEMNHAFSAYFSKTQAKKGLYLNLWQRNNLWANQDMIDLIKSKKPAFLIGVHPLTKVGARYTSTSSGHALAIKGFDGDRLHIQDPWGMDHFARIQVEKIQMSNGAQVETTTFKDFGASRGTFMGTYGSDHKIVLDEVLGVSLD